MTAAAPPTQNTLKPSSAPTIRTATWEVFCEWKVEEGAMSMLRRVETLASGPEQKRARQASRDTVRPLLDAQSSAAASQPIPNSYGFAPAKVTESRQSNASALQQPLGTPSSTQTTKGSMQRLQESLDTVARRKTAVDGATRLPKVTHRVGGTQAVRKELYRQQAQVTSSLADTKSIILQAGKLQAAAGPDDPAWAILRQCLHQAMIDDKNLGAAHSRVMDAIPALARQEIDGPGLGSGVPAAAMRKSSAGRVTMFPELGGLTSAADPIVATPSVATPTTPTPAHDRQAYRLAAGPASCF